MSIFNFKVCSVAVILVLLMFSERRLGIKPGSVLYWMTSRESEKVSQCLQNN